MSRLKKTQIILYFNVFALLCLTVFRVNARADETASLVGQTPGSFNVENGAAAYSIPIMVPPGVNKLEPRPALKYSSRAPNGLLGIGWNISGLSAIHRGGATIAQDGFKGGVYYSSKDRFFLDGRRLIAISGDDGGDGTEYRTEIDGFSKIVSEGSAGSGPASFTVTTRDGMLMEYGGTADSRIEAQGKSSVRMWMLSKVTDTSGNVMTYTYHENVAEGESRVTRIDYAGGNNSVRFEYEDRHDPVVKYSAGSKISMTQRLKSVKTYADYQGADTLVREYRLNYRASSAHGKSFLESVQEFDGGGSALPPVRFTWETGADGFDSPYQWFQASSGSYSETHFPPFVTSALFQKTYGNVYSMLLDMNGDGLTDRVSYRNWQGGDRGFYVGLNNGRDLDSPAEWISNPNTGNLLDEWPTIPVYVFHNFGSGATRNGGIAPLYISKIISSAIMSLRRATARSDGSYPGDTRVSKGFHTKFRNNLNYTPAATLLDMNGDGLPDKVAYQNWQNGTAGFYVGLNNGSGFDSPVEWIRDGQSAQTWYHYPIYADEDHTYSDLMDMNGDGLPDKVAYKDWRNGSAGFYVGLNNGGGFNPPARWISRAQSGRTWQNNPVHKDSSGNTCSKLMDMNGDGLPDKVAYQNWEDGTAGFYVGLNNGSGFDSPAEWITNGQSGQTWYHYPIYADDDHTYSDLMDMNGDGLPDKVAYQNWEDGTAGFYVGLNNGAGFESPQDWISRAQSSQTWQNNPIHKNSGGNICSKLMDMNGDGLPDKVAYQNWEDGISGFYVGLNNGSGFGAPVKWTSPAGDVSVYPVHVNTTSNTEYAYSYIDADLRDINGDGLPDRIQSSHWGSGTSGFHVGLNTGRRPIITSITSSMDLTTTIEYKSLSDSSVHTKNSGSVYPVVDIAGPTRLVSRVSSSNGIGGMNHLSYQYGGAKVHVQGRGNLGFEWIESTNEQTGIVTRTEFRQDFPYVGKPERMKVKIREAERDILIKDVVDMYDDIYREEALYGGKVYFPYAVESVKADFEVDGTFVAGEVTQNSDFDDYGNVGKTVVTKTGGGQTFVKTTTSAYHNDISNWFLGQLTASSSVYKGYGHTQTRASGFTYDSATGLLLTKTTEPGDADLKLTETYQYDKFGNRISVSLSGKDVQTRTTRTAFDSNGLFPKTITNALGHTETWEYDPRWGVPTRLTGPNRLVTDWEYDSLGREEQESRVDGTQTAWAYAWSDQIESGASYSDTTHKIYKVTETSSGAPPKTVYYDAMDRAVRQETTGFDGRAVYQDKEYDASGREVFSSLPYFSGNEVYTTETYVEPDGTVCQRRVKVDDGRAGGVETQYDEIGRAERIIYPGPDGADSVNSVSYSGLLTTETNALLQTKTTTKDVLGNVVQVNEEEGASVTYSYDALGNLLETDAAGVTTTMTYDNRNRKISMSDPDMGGWTYTYNAFDELISQTNAKNQTVTMDYDKLGRMVKRTETEGVSTWTYDTANMGKGKLASERAPHADGFSRTYGYDGFGRPDKVETKIAGRGTFLSRTFYDSEGRVSKKMLPGGFVLKNVYTDDGYLSAVKSLGPRSVYDLRAMSIMRQRCLDFAGHIIGLIEIWSKTLPRIFARHIRFFEMVADYFLTLAETIEHRMQRIIEVESEMVDDEGNLSFWEVAERDASRRLTRFRFGNGLETRRNYDPATGHLGRIRTVLGSNAPIRDLEYTYDKVNNVKRRIDHVNNLREVFSYDDLNRLTGASLSGAISQSISYAYDAKGNMTSKSGVGTYVYGGNSAGPHAVTSVTASDGTSRTFSYDDNGNMIRKTTTSGQTTETMSIAWTSFDKPSRFTKGGLENAFSYGPDRARHKKTVTRSGAVESVTVYIGKDYEKVTENGRDVHKYFVYAEGQLAAIYKRVDGHADETRYLHRDSLGSIDTVTNGLGDVEEKMAYAPFGSPRSVDGQPVNFSLSFTNRGFTGHEHIDDMGIIHMNGRVYDPEIGRFLSPDSFIQDIYSSQSFNRYTYCLNNPLQFTDPSGHFIDILIRAISGAVFGGVMAAINGGDILEGMITGAVSAVIFGFAGDLSAGLEDIAQVGIHVAAGAVSAGANGVITGADPGMMGESMLISGISAGVAKYGGLKLFGGSGILAGAMDNMSPEARFFVQFASYSAIGGVSGGISSSMRGGDFGDGFEQGARTSAYGFLYNMYGQRMLSRLKAYFDWTGKTEKCEEAVYDGVKKATKALVVACAVTVVVAAPEIVEGVVVVGKVAWPIIVTTAPRWTPYVEAIGVEVLSEFTGPNIPNPPNDPIGAIRILYDAIKYPSKYFRMNEE
ncbi:conserved hypothetical protein [Candidatus Desulfarcum epimagneticum]|uniref:Uncharacterized protein n=1 Tax=uncultured Desulfobacteraceae bacterium TaxID=218296 RepID=A0A484HK48_9BACT|nr:conserved hypothetical protein [uncultured Desulfobacteraceae bacterium]